MTKELPDVEVVAAQVHAAWIKAKTEQGMHSRKAEDGEELMVPYEMLSDKQKETDRVLVRTVYDAIKRIRYTDVFPS